MDCESMFFLPDLLILLKMINSLILKNLILFYFRTSFERIDDDGLCDGADPVGCRVPIAGLNQSIKKKKN
jgi:hypothetical protein